MNANSMTAMELIAHAEAFPYPDDQAKRRQMPTILDLYAEELESSSLQHTRDAGLSSSLRFAAKMLREIEDITEILNTAGVAVGDEHHGYTLIERVQWLATAKQYAWKRYDTLLAAVSKESV